MSTVITPTVGRKVWYRPFGHNRTLLGVWDDAQPCDATVTFVWHDRMVNLHVIGPSGAVHQFNSVLLLGRQALSTAATPSGCHTRRPRPPKPPPDT